MAIKKRKSAGEVVRSAKKATRRVRTPKEIGANAVAKAALRAKGKYTEDLRPGRGGQVTYELRGGKTRQKIAADVNSIATESQRKSEANRRLRGTNWAKARQQGASAARYERQDPNRNANRSSAGRSSFQTGAAAANQASGRQNRPRSMEHNKAVFGDATIQKRATERAKASEKRRGAASKVGKTVRKATTGSAGKGSKSLKSRKIASQARKRSR
jgi:hypothetical protein